ncbi:aldehyde dehydrogenase family protein [Desmospora activa]|uniref:Aldehyde dehydrogenase (NAD+) n=1 Tax=Desmospora activa DSM 45169 TaxID=1121389 RepID=A0A2T4ZAB4_9BACL|nr:aldehyde dehydrogenase family protein [Desmospora activa]PTM58838.1 aldehyde dehydrogenase (NAD+) [Desmospora activa DSM 45169]
MSYLVQSWTEQKRNQVPFPDRVEPLERTIQFMKENPSAVMNILTEISLHRSASYELSAAISTLEGALHEVSTHRPPQLNQMAVFMPSNVILYSYVLYLLVPSLFVQEIHFRPSSQIKDQLIRLHQLLKDVHGLPIEIQPISQRKFLKQYVAQANLIVFTGAYKNAEEIKLQLNKEQIYLFFGQGVNPFIVAPGADLQSAVSGAIDIRLLNSGQDCLGPDAFFIHESHLPMFTEMLTRQLDSLKFGDNTDAEADWGPIYYDSTLEMASQYLHRHHSDIIRGGSVNFRSRIVEPTVLLRDFEENFEIVEFFSPVFNVVRYRDEGKLIDLLRSGFFMERALGASVYGKADKVVEILKKRHTVTINTTLLSIDDGNSPFGGYGPMANYISYNEKLSFKPILVSQAVGECLRAER